MLCLMERKDLLLSHAFASRTLSSSEKAYAQVEKEARGIFFGVNRFHKYLYGRKVTHMTKHIVETPFW